MPAMFATSVYHHETARGSIECQVLEATAASMEIVRGDWERGAVIEPEWRAKIRAWQESQDRRARRGVKTINCTDAGIDPEQIAAPAEPLSTRLGQTSQPAEGCSPAAYRFWRETIADLSKRKRGQPGYGSAPGPKWRHH